MLDLCPGPVMDVLNLTADSLSDGGDFFSLDDALRCAEHMVRESADILDVGDESTGPGVAPVSLETLGVDWALHGGRDI